MTEGGTHKRVRDLWCERAGTGVGGAERRRYAAERVEESARDQTSTVDPLSKTAPREDFSLGGHVHAAAGRTRHTLPTLLRPQR